MKGDKKDNKKIDQGELAKEIEENLLYIADLHEYRDQLLEIDVSSKKTLISKMANHRAESHIENLKRFGSL